MFRLFMTFLGFVWGLITTVALGALMFHSLYVWYPALTWGQQAGCIVGGLIVGGMVAADAWMKN